MQYSTKEKFEEDLNNHLVPIEVLVFWSLKSSSTFSYRVGDIFPVHGKGSVGYCFTFTRSIKGYEREPQYI